MGGVNNFDSIIDASFKLSCVCGFDNVPVVDIERVSGVSSGAIYYHFDSKDDILQEIFKQYLCEEFEKFKQYLVNIEGDFDYKLRFIFNYLTNHNILLNSPVLKELEDYRTYYLFLFSCFHEHYEIKAYVYNTLSDMESCFEEIFGQDLNFNNVNLIFSIVKSFILTIALFSDDFDLEDCIKCHINLIKYIV